MFYTITNGHVMVTINSRGGEIFSILDFDKDTKEYIWVGDEKYWAGRAPNIFPIVGRVKEGKYTYNGNEYSIKSPHGFVRITEMNVIDHTDNAFTMSLSSNDETLASYPFEFDYKVRYTLDDRKLTVDYEVVNPSPTETLIFALGAH
ncbi:MAG: aldose 1-epimerase family protein, partial [Ruminococcaceae bacterium]|nr:aldose 1-epimerase family protein [Oscillospiraceae bacterium]